MPDDFTHKWGSLRVNEGVVSKETVVLHRGEVVYKNLVLSTDNVNWPPYRDSKS